MQDANARRQISTVLGFVSLAWERHVQIQLLLLADLTAMMMAIMLNEWPKGIFVFVLIEYCIIPFT